MSMSVFRTSVIHNMITFTHWVSPVTDLQYNHEYHMVSVEASTSGSASEAEVLFQESWIHKQQECFYEPVKFCSPFSHLSTSRTLSELQVCSYWRKLFLFHSFIRNISETWDICGTWGSYVLKKGPLDAFIPEKPSQEPLVAAPLKKNP